MPILITNHSAVYQIFRKLGTYVVGENFIQGDPKKERPKETRNTK